MAVSSVESKQRRDKRQKKEQLIAAVHDEHERFMAAKAGLRRELERRLKEELFKHEYAQSVAANKAVAGGVSKTAIGRAIGNMNWDSIKACLELSAEMFDESKPGSSLQFFANDDNTVSVKWEGYVSELEFRFLHDQLGETEQNGYNADLDMTVGRNAAGAWTVLDHGNNVVKLFDGTVTRPSHGLVKGDLDESEAALPGAKLGRLLSEWEAGR